MEENSFNAVTLIVVELKLQGFYSILQVYLKRLIMSFKLRDNREPLVLFSVIKREGIIICFTCRFYSNMVLMVNLKSMNRKRNVKRRWIYEDLTIVDSSFYSFYMK